MSRIFVAGLGAVSPSGWTVAALRQALDQGEPLPIQLMQRPGWDKPLRARLVPNPPARLPFLAHPRFRRSSPITHYAAAAMLEATASIQENPDENRRWGLVVCIQSGCVQYTERFFSEALKDPSTASPLLFPETVFGAPASHLAALLGNTVLVQTLIGDPASFAQGLGLAAMWLNDDQTDACVVVGAEEISWLRADALWHLEHTAVISCGAGAVCLTRDAGCSAGVELEGITDAHTYSNRCGRVQAAKAMRGQMRNQSPGSKVQDPSSESQSSGGDGNELLCDGVGDSPRVDAAELAAWADWQGLRLSPKRILGEGLMAAATWQCVAACDAVATGRVVAANVSLIGCNQQAIGVRVAQVS
jgi:hypothetical protein